MNITTISMFRYRRVTDIIEREFMLSGATVLEITFDKMVFNSSYVCKG